MPNYFDRSHVRMSDVLFLFFAVGLVVFMASCAGEDSGVEDNSHQKMINLLAETSKKIEQDPNFMYASEAKLHFCDSLLAITTDPAQIQQLKFRKAGILLEFGKEASAVALYEEMAPTLSPQQVGSQTFYIAMGTAYVRLAERTNCVLGHNADACTLPFKGLGIHQDKAPSRKAIDAFALALEADPGNYDALWLINIAYMTLGEYPNGVPAAFLIPGMDAVKDRINPFISMAPDLGIASDNCSGGSLVEDFNNDGLLDIITSSWHLTDPMFYYQNKGDGTFEDRSKASGLSDFTGGLNMTTTDYNNDGFVDVFVLRGGWLATNEAGKQPNSLLRNNGDGTFTDVTIDAGLLSFKPTQTATWNDFNLDGWLDVFIAYETANNINQYPCELFLNNKNETFTNVAPAAGIDFSALIKGVTSGDYNNDGWTDLFFSTMNGEKLLLKNKGLQNGVPMFENATKEAGFDKELYSSFPTWFFDYNNDGWLDVFVCNFAQDRPLSFYAAQDFIKPSSDNHGKPRVYRNNGNGTFTNVSEELRLNQPVFAMGSNFGDIDNDGWLDMYLGSGNPFYQSLVPNKLYRNVKGKYFADVTASSRTGNLQKGHAVSFGDMDNDGDQDIHIEMGGAFKGDNYPTLFYLNPGQPGNNNWINLKLEGTTTNKAAVGVRVAVTFTENGKKRTVYRDVNSGGSFGCSPFRCEIGIGNATTVEQITVYWPASRQQQIFTQVAGNTFYKLVEGQTALQTLQVPKLQFKHADGSIPMCAPQL